MPAHPNSIDINTDEVEILVHVAKDYLRLVDASTITLNQGGEGGFGGKTANQIRGLINRFFRARYGIGRGPGDMADT